MVLLENYQKVCSTCGAGVRGNLAPPKFGPPGPNFLGNLAPWGPPLRKFGPLEKIVYLIAISSEIMKLLLKPRS